MEGNKKMRNQVNQADKAIVKTNQVKMDAQNAEESKAGLA